MVSSFGQQRIHRPSVRPSVRPSLPFPPSVHPPTTRHHTTSIESTDQTTRYKLPIPSDDPALDFRSELFDADRALAHPALLPPVIATAGGAPSAGAGAGAGAAPADGAALRPFDNVNKCRSLLPQGHKDAVSRTATVKRPNNQTAAGDGDEVSELAVVVVDCCLLLAEFGTDVRARGGMACGSDQPRSCVAHRATSTSSDAATSEHCDCGVDLTSPHLVLGC